MLLLSITAAVAYVLEAFVVPIEPLVEKFGTSELSVGLVLVPTVGNISEHIVSVQITYKNQMDFFSLITTSKAASAGFGIGRTKDLRQGALAEVASTSKG